MAVRIRPGDFSFATAELVRFAGKHDCVRMDEVVFEERPEGLAILAEAPNGARFEHLVPAVQFKTKPKRLNG